MIDIRKQNDCQRLRVKGTDCRQNTRELCGAAETVSILTVVVVIQMHTFVNGSLPYALKINLYYYM